MPEQVRTIVSNWQKQYHKAFISVENADKCCPHEDAKVTIINLFTEKQQTERVAGEMAGYTKLSPTSTIPLPPGIIAVETGFFCGTPYCNILQNNKQQIT